MTEWPPQEGTTLVEGMPEEDYHAHPALSASGMKQILRSPKHYMQSRNERVEKPAFDVGHAAHALVLGVGQPIVEVPDEMLASNGALSTTRAKEFVAEARANGQVPLKRDTFLRVRGMADAVLANAKARAILERPRYTEVSLFALDPETGVPLRGRLDVLTGALVADVKTTPDVREHKLRSVIQDFGYDVQGEVYRLLVQLVLDIDAEPVQLIFVEKDAPHEVRVVKLGEGWQAGGFARMRRAIEVFQSCVEFGVWPGADDEEGEASEIEPPAYYLADVARLTGAVA
ncbi:PD-(D/E)XK nuclease-like domain-containing protein [Microbacterium sp. NPDC007973]|uniref:PD-(D/E)XK nuclease-like domain-containing protein n=1 Tax=Microbacterium sp. NPDC007973 TaxID=3364182 RepID=UPI0036E6D0A0